MPEKCGQIQRLQHGAALYRRDSSRPRRAAPNGAMPGNHPCRGAIHRAGETAADSACQRFVRVFGACSKRFCARRAIGLRHQPDGFSGGKKYVPCILKYV